MFQKNHQFLQSRKVSRSDRIQTTGQQLQLVLMSTCHTSASPRGSHTWRPVLIALTAMGISSPTMASTFRQQPRREGCSQRISILPSAAWSSPLACELISPVDALLLTPSLIAEPVFPSFHPGVGTSGSSQNILDSSTRLGLLWLQPCGLSDWQLSPPLQMRGRHCRTTLIADAFRTEKRLGF